MKSKIIDKYYVLEQELAKIADYYGVTRDYLIDNVHDYPKDIIDKIDEILDKQLLLLAES